MCVCVCVCVCDRVCVIVCVCDRVCVFVCVQVSQHRVQQDTVFFTNALRGFDGFIVSDVRVFHGVWFGVGCRRACSLALSPFRALSLSLSRSITEGLSATHTPARTHARPPAVYTHKHTRTLLVTLFDRRMWRR